MKKYLQIVIVLGIFGFFVWLRQAKGTNDQNFVVSPQSNLNASPVSTGQTATPSPSAAPQQGNATQTSQPVPSATPSPTPTGNQMMQMGMYKNGTFTGTVQDAFYGYVQVQVVVSGGKITAVNFLQHPNDNPTSQYINSQAMPLLQQEVIQAQSGNVNMISGASATSQAFLQSIADALSQAK